jgi:hypothetical protein
MRRPTLIVLATLAVLQGGLLLWELRRGDRLAADATAVLELERDRIDAIEIRRPGSAAVELRRSGERWSLIRPIRDLAAEEAVERILAAAELLESWRSPPPQASSASLGLASPAVELSLRDGERRQELRLGALDPSRQGAYLETSGKRLVVARALLDAVSCGTDELRDRTLVRLAQDGLRRIERSGGEQPLELVREAAGSWWQQGSEWRMPVAPEASERLLSPRASCRPPRGRATRSEFARRLTAAKRSCRSAARVRVIPRKRR